MINFKCSQCDEPLEAPVSMQGELLPCPKCRYPERVPIPEEEAPPIKIEEVEETQDQHETQIKTFKTETGASEKKDFSRPLIPTSEGATRVRTFKIKLIETVA